MVISPDGILNNSILSWERKAIASTSKGVVIKPIDFEKIKKNTFNKLSLFANAFPEVIVTSTKKNIGIENLRASISKIFVWEK